MTLLVIFCMAAIDDLLSYAYGQVPDPNIEAYQHKPTMSNQPYSDLITKYSQKFGIDPNWVSMIINQESMFNPMAVSKAGAQGLGQLMPKTAMSLGVKDPFNPEDNIQGTTNYLSQLLKQFHNDKTLATAAYNAGPGAVKKYNGIPPYKETKHYLKSVLGGSLATN